MIVDGTALLYRAFHAYSGRAGDGSYFTRTVTEDDGEYTSFHLRPGARGGGGELSVVGSDGAVEVTSATYGFLRQLLPTLVQASSTLGAQQAAPERPPGGSGRLLPEKFRAATHLAVCFDSNVRNFRHELFPSYKRNRVDRECPDGVIVGKRRMLEILGGLGVAVFESREGFEADDIIGSICAHAVRCGIETEVMSNDKDFMQLLRAGDPRVSIIKPAPKGTRPAGGAPPPRARGARRLTTRLPRQAAGSSTTRTTTSARTTPASTPRASSTCSRSAGTPPTASPGSGGWAPRPR